jgi:hypothetical protein
LIGRVDWHRVRSCGKIHGQQLAPFEWFEEEPPWELPGPLRFAATGNGMPKLVEVMLETHDETPSEKEPFCPSLEGRNWGRMYVSETVEQPIKRSST